METIQLAKKVLEKQGYRFIGDHSAVKVCHYTKSSILGKDSCYKQKFYSIQSHQCVQMTPNMICNNMCCFCWRSMHYCNDIKITTKIDNPKDIVDRAISAQINLLNGFGGDARTNKIKFLESKNIKHMAISLTGEPTMYSKLPEFIKELSYRNITSFLVTNGQFPKAIEKLKVKDALPTQLYISLDAPTRELYKRIDKPMLQDYWQRFSKTLEILPTLNTRTVLRITAVKNINMCNELDYSKLIKKAMPQFLEIKGFSLIGASRERLAIENMPTYEEVKEFAKRISKLTQYKLIYEDKNARAILLMIEDKDRCIKNE